jgi:hypothetical protein
MSQKECEVGQFDTRKGFDEEEWIRLLFLVSDLQQWLEDIEKRLFLTVPVGGKKKLFRKDFYLTAKSFAHIIERHYYKISRHPEAGKFTIPVPDLLALLKQTRHLPTTPIPGRDGIYREVDVGKIIGYDRAGRNTSFVTLISHPQGRIETAFPGIMELRHSNIQAEEQKEQTEKSA